MGSRREIRGAEKSVYAFLVTALISTTFSLNAQAGIVNSKHDLSYTSTATIKATNAADNQICIFCHTPHNANPAVPLWNHDLSPQTYTLYSSDTLQAAPGQPDGASKLCLSCHDGTVAVGGVVNKFRTGSGSDPIPTTSTYITGKANMGTNLADDHPVSMTISTTDTEINPVPTNPAVKLDASGKVQCTSCHDPHTPNKDPLVTKFLVMRNDDGASPAHGSQICLACHDKAGWTASAHYGATDTYTSTGHPYSGKPVSTWACEACHTPHTASKPVWLLNAAGTTKEEEVCYRCHADAATQPGDDVKPATDSGRGHRFANYTGVHKPLDKPLGDGTKGTEAPLVTTVHVECTDCHVPHKTQVQTTRSMGSNVVSTSHGQALLGVTVQAVTYAGGAWTGATFGANKEASYEYEICFRCHSTGSTAFPAGSERGSIDVYFNPNNQAHHAVVAPGKIRNTAMNDTFVSGSGLTIDSTLYCSDCHDPHATNAYLLKETGVNLCYRCHRSDVYGPRASYSYLSAWSGHSIDRHHSPRDINGYPPDFPPELKGVSCLWCHGDFGTVKDVNNYEPGGIHGANRGNTRYPKTDSGVHFLNGFAIQWRDDGRGNRTCWGYGNSSLGCTAHSSGTSYQANW